MSIAASARPVSHPLKAPFRISRGVKTAAEVVEVIARVDGHVGRGESVPYARYGETVESVLAQLASVFAADDVEAACAALPSGAARNALDLALWDLRARHTGVSVAQATGLPVPSDLVTAVTVSLDTPEAMGAIRR